MRVPQLVSEFFDWRWAPCVGLTAGSLAFALLAVALIPTQFDGAPRSSDASGSLLEPSAPTQHALFGASLAAQNIPGLSQRPSEVVSPRPPRPAPVAPVAAPAVPLQRGFSPIADRPEPPPPPPPVAPPPPPPPLAPLDAPPPPQVPPEVPAPPAAPPTDPGLPTAPVQ